MWQFYERDGIWYPVPEPVPLRIVIFNALCNALAFHDGVQHLAAASLGLSQRVMTYQLQQHGIPTARTEGKPHTARRIITR